MWFRLSNILIETSFNLLNQATKELLKPLVLGWQQSSGSWLTIVVIQAFLINPQKCVAALLIQ
jgi:hypothetical protein